jgi:signal recognition particle GTPase
MSETPEQWARRTIPVCAECGTGHDDRPHMQEHYHKVTLCNWCGNEHRLVDSCPPATSEKMAERDEQRRHRDALKMLSHVVVDTAVNYRKKYLEIQDAIDGVESEEIPEVLKGMRESLEYADVFFEAVDALIEELAAVKGPEGKI